MGHSGEGDGLIGAALRLLRLHLDLDVAFVSELTDGARVFRHVDTDEPGLIEVGDADPAEESYCHHVVAGRMPQYLPDPSAHPVAAGMAATSAMPVGTHFSVPLYMSDGSVYGTFCGFSHEGWLRTTLSRVSSSVAVRPNAAASSWRYSPHVVS